MLALCRTRTASPCSLCYLQPPPAGVRTRKLGGQGRGVARVGGALEQRLTAGVSEGMPPASCPACELPAVGATEVQSRMGGLVPRPNSGMAAAAHALTRTLSTPRSSVDTNQAGCCPLGPGACGVTSLAGP